MDCLRAEVPQAGLRWGLCGGPARLPLQVEELPADLELLSRMALQLGPPVCGLGLINFQEEEGM